MYICQICLRTDRKLKLIDTRLADFHDELCEYALACNLHPQYCTICEHLLRKVYNFKARCCAADKILKNYKKLKMAKEDLYTLLPPSTLGAWKESTAHVYNYKYDDKPQSTLTANKEQTLSISKLDIKLEHPTVEISVPGVFPKEEEVILPILASNDNVKESNDPLMEAAEIKIEVVDHVEENLEIFHIPSNLIGDPKVEKVFNLEENRETETENLEENAKKQDLLRKLVNDMDINSDLDDIENNIKTDSEFDDLEELLDTIDIPDESSLNSADDCDSDDLILNDNVYNRKEKMKKMKQKKTVPKKKKQSKTADSLEKQKDLTNKSLLELTNISISDEEFANDSNKKRLEKTNKTKKSVIKNIDQSKVTKMKKTAREQMKLKKMEEHAAETVRKFCLKISQRRPKQFCKEWLKATLKSKFESCGELKTEDGTVIDKECILNSIEERESSNVKKLWRVVRSTNTVLIPPALSLFKVIQEKYENDKKYTSVFEIQYLNSEEKMMEEFSKRRTYDNYVNAEYICDLCHQWFKFKKLLQYHMRCHDVKSGDFECTVCKMRQRTKFRLMKHMLTHKEVFKCKLCPLVTNYRSSMINHYHQHKGVEYKCQHCALIFKSQSAYNSHRAKCETHLIACPWCARTFYGKIGLRQHIHLKHREAPPIEPTTSETCSQCDITFVTREVYQKHLRISHSTIKTDPTQQVGRRKKRPGEPRRLSIFTCRVCNAKGGSNGWLALHFELEHPSIDMSALYTDKANHLCEICGKGYSCMYGLRDHMNKHTGARPFACDQCPSRFTAKTYLVNHKQLHAMPRWPCTRCGKKFHAKGNLYSHMRSHIRDRRFKCPVCGKGFLHRGAMKEHVRGVHDNVRRVKKRPAASSTRSCMEEDESEVGASLMGIKGRPLASETEIYKEANDSE